VIAAMGEREKCQCPSSKQRFDESKTMKERGHWKQDVEEREQDQTWRNETQNNTIEFLRNHNFCKFSP